MLSYLNELRNINYKELDNYSVYIKESMLFNKISEKDSEFLLSIINRRKFNILTEEVLLNNKAVSNILAINVAPEGSFNKGHNKTSYFKVYRQPTHCGNNEDCLRISIYMPVYNPDHMHTLDKLLDVNEQNELIRILNLQYIPSANNDARFQYERMMSLWHMQLEEYYKANNIKKYILPEVPTLWIAVLYYFNYVNNFTTNASLTLPMPDYHMLPTGYTKDLIRKGNKK